MSGGTFINDAVVPSYSAEVTSDRKLKVDATVTTTAESTAEATAAAPTYTEGQDAPLSQNLTGDLRTIAKQTTSGTMTVTQVTVPATANGISLVASNSSRKGLIITNPGTVSVYYAQTNGVTTSSAIIPAASSLVFDVPNYTGAVFGIVATGTQVVSVTELT